MKQHNRTNVKKLTKGNRMKIWIDADACPKPIKEVAFKAAMKREIHLIMVANQIIQHPRSPFIKMIKVSSGFDVADNYIAANVEANDIVITADVPLADLVVKANAFAIEPRGKLLTADTIAERVATRNLMESLRTIGEVSGGPKAFSAQDTQAFANGFDRLLTRLIQAQK